jgi:hypothetical protein
VHGDDLTFVGAQEGLDFVEKKMKERHELKVNARLGDGLQGDKETDILGRLVRCTPAGFGYEADPRHRCKVLEVLGFSEKKKGLSVNVRVEELAEELVELEAAEGKSFRALAARLNYLAQDSPEEQFAAKEVCRDMARPNQDSWRKLNLLARFILEREAVIWMFEWQGSEAELRVYSYSDWAGCRRTRRSTSGGALMMGGALSKDMELHPGTRSSEQC